MNKKQILFASFSHFVCDVNSGSLPAILPFLVSAHGLSYSMASALMLANSSLASIVQPIFGLLADRRARPWHMPAGILITGCGMAAVGFLDSYPAIFLVVMASGMGSALFHPAAVRFANMVSGSAPGTGMSIFSVGGNAGYLLAPILVVALMHLGGLPGLGLLAPLAAVLAGLMFYESLRFTRAQANGAQPRPNTAGRSRTVNDWQAFAKLTVNVICRSIIMVCLRAFIPLYWIAHFGQSETAAALALTVFGACGVCSNLAGGMLADRFGYRRVVRTSHALLLPLMLAFPFVDDFAVATVMLMALGVVQFLPFSSLVVLGQRYLGGHAGFAAGITMGLGMSVGGMAAPVLGRVADIWGLGTAFHVLSGCALVSTIFAFLLSPAPKLPEDEEAT